MSYLVKTGLPERAASALSLGAISLVLGVVFETGFCFLPQVGHHLGLLFPLLKCQDYRYVLTKPKFSQADSGGKKINGFSAVLENMAFPLSQPEAERNLSLILTMKTWGSL